MVTTLCLISCLLVPAQPGDRAGWLLAPRLSKGQELLYRGSFVEESLGTSVQCQRQFSVETRLFVLEATPQGADVALLTTLKPKTPSTQGVQEPPPSLVRLELAHVDPQGRLVPDKGSSLAVPLDGPPSLECGSLIEVPRTRVGVGQSWEVGEDGRPLRTWQVAAVEPIAGISHVKLTGVQQSDDWTRPRLDRGAWQRLDTVWVAPQLGSIRRVERTILRRDPGHDNPTQRSVLSYELTSNLQYTPDFYEDRQFDIQQAKIFWDASVPLLVNPARNPGQLDSLLARIDYHLQKRGQTPYREAVVRVKRRIEAARRGEALVPQEEPVPLIPTATVDQPAPDFVVPNFSSDGDSAKLRQWLGKPILLVFYNPASEKTVKLLRYLQEVATQYGPAITVVGLALSEDGDQVRKQGTELHLTFPLLCGTGLRLSYAVEATPKVFVVDADGMVRASYVGWGLEVQEGITAGLQQWLSRKAPPPK